jgi:hypothetical protein
VLVEPDTTWLVELLDVIEVPGGQKTKEGGNVEGFVVVDAFERGIELRYQMLVSGLMFKNRRKSLFQKEALFTLKVHPGEVDEAFEVNADAAAVGSAQQHDAQFVEGIHEDAVLVVDGLDADDALVTPCQQRHKFLREQGQV